MDQRTFRLVSQGRCPLCGLPFTNEPVETGVYQCCSAICEFEMSYEMFNNLSHYYTSAGEGGNENNE